MDDKGHRGLSGCKKFTLFEGTQESVQLFCDLHNHDSIPLEIAKLMK